MQQADGLNRSDTATEPISPEQSFSGGPSVVSAATALQGLILGVDSGRLSSMIAYATGFEPLDNRLSGGIKPGELILMAGEPGCGKTTMAFQMARNIAEIGCATCLYVCYEHDAEFLLNRLIAMESIDGGRGDVLAGVTARQLRKHFTRDYTDDGILFEDIVSMYPGLQRGVERIQTYGDRLQIIEASSARTTVQEIADLVGKIVKESGLPLVVFVDYLQKMALETPAISEFERISKVVIQLKDLAMSNGVPIVAIAASDKGGLMAKRMRPYHLWGGSALAYEADVILMLADKWDAIAKMHIEFNVHRAQNFHDWVVCSIEKNRSGKDLVDMEFRKLFSFGCFNPNGGVVEESLIDERVFTE